MRVEFSNWLVRTARKDPKVILLTGDHGYAIFDDFRSRCASQYINAGVAEQNMIGMAAGLARAGFRPFVYALSAFVPLRVLEQIKLDIAHDKLPVVLFGDGAGLVYSYLGTSHQATEDIACTRVIPSLAVISPADRFEISMCMDYAYELRQPVYLRIGKADRGDIHPGPLAATLGTRLLPVRRGVVGGLSLIATGSLVRTAAELVDTVLPKAAVWSAPFLKPIDVDQVAEICVQSSALITLEEHSIYGGLGSIVSEIASASHPTPILRIGIQDCFSMSCGSYDYLLREQGLHTSSIARKIHSFVSAVGSRCRSQKTVTTMDGYDPIGQRITCFNGRD